MMMLFPRKKQKTYRITLGSRSLKGSLQENAVKKYIPGLLHFPQYKLHYGIGRRTVQVDLSDLSKRFRYSQPGNIGMHIMGCCLGFLFTALRELEQEPFLDPGHLCSFLHDSLKVRDGDWSQVLKYFISLAYLLDSLDASYNLRSDLARFVMQNSKFISQYTSLQTAMQFVEACPKEHFEQVMHHMFQRLPERDQEKLLRSCGNINLPYSPSDKVQSYIRSLLESRYSPETNHAIVLRRRNHRSILDRSYDSDDTLGHGFGLNYQPW
ncbi:hypothetical protein FQN57_003572 [Myotisia sp. PD_48]|nr:hypothetical protein FQN57_003572 [Myotisia sp. PD_48]